MSEDPSADLRPRFVPGDLPRGPRRVYLTATVFFLVVFVALIWPVYPAFAEARPFVLGVPFSLVYVVALLLIAFAVLLGLYLWEGRRGLHDPLEPDDRDREASARSRTRGSRGSSDPGPGGSEDEAPSASRE